MNSPESRQNARSATQPPGDWKRWCAFPARWTLVVGLIFCLVGGESSGQDATEGGRQLPTALRLAHGLFRQRKYDLAADEYARFLETDPNGPDGDDARFGLASARLLQGRYRDSREAFSRFIDLAPNHPRARTAWYRLGELSYMLGELDEARKALERFTSEPAEHTNLETAWTYLGDVQSALDDPKAARTSYEHALKSFPNARLADRARYGLGRSLAATGETQPAIDVLEELIRRNPPEWTDKARLQVGKIELGAGRFEAAEKSLEQVKATGAILSEARLRRAQALVKLNRQDEAGDLLRPLANDPNDPTSIEASLELAGVDLRSDRPAEALKTLDAAISRAGKSPTVPVLMFRSAEALRSLGRNAEARERFLKMAEIAPGDPWADDAWLESARLALQAGDHAAAGKLASEFAPKFPESRLLADARLIEARTANAQRRPEAAVAALEPLVGAGAKPVETSPETLEAARSELASAYRALGKSAEADAILATLSKSSRKETAADAAFMLGRSHLEAGRFAEAAAEFQRYLDSANGQVADHALANLAVAELGRGRRDEARTAVHRLADRFPDSPTLPAARLRLAEARAQAGEYPAAVEEFRPLAESTDPKLPAAYKDRAELGLARALVKQGDSAHGAKLFDAIVARTTDESQAASLALERARAVEAAGDVADAITAYEQVETRAPKLDAALFAALARARLLADGHPDKAAELLAKLLDGDAARDRLKAIDQPIDALQAELGWNLIDAGKHAEADAVFRELLDAAPKGPYAADARFNLAESANERKDHAEVVKLLGPLIEPDVPEIPERLAADVLYRLGRTYVERGEWPQAGETLDRLIAAAPTNPRIREARFLRAEAALRQDQFETAEKALADLIAAPASPDDPPDLIRLARERSIQCFLGLNRWQAALDAADALKPTITDPAARDPVEFARGRALLGLGRPEEARAAFQAVIDSRKSGDLAAQAQLMRGEAYFHEDKLLQALREFLQVDVLYKAPRRQAAALLEAGKVYEKMERWVEAAETYADLLNRPEFAGDPHAAEAKSRRDKILTEHPNQP